MGEPAAGASPAPSSGASSRANTRRAEANAPWICVTTPEISLNGLVYWFAYDRNTCTSPTVSTAGNPVTTPTNPATATTAYMQLLTNRVPGFASELKNCARSPAV